MGLNIGAAGRAVSALPPAGYNRPDRTAAPRERQTEDRVELVQGPEEPEIRAGFGENTLSPSAAALEALDSNLEVAGRLVPTVQELRQRAQINQAERPDAIEPRPERAPELRRRETVRPEPNPAVRNFVTAPEPSAARTGPAEAPSGPDFVGPRPQPQPPTSRVDIRI